MITRRRMLSLIPGACAAPVVLALRGGPPEVMTVGRGRRYEEEPAQPIIITMHAAVGEEEIVRVLRRYLRAHGNSGLMR